MVSVPTRSSRCATHPDRLHIVAVAGFERMLHEAGRPPRLLRRMLSEPGRPLDPATFHSQLLFDQDLPAAALSRRLDCPDDAEGIWLRADPVTLTPDLGAVWVGEGSRLDPVSPVVKELSAMFADEGMELHVPVPERAYLRLPSLPDCQFTPPWLLAGESMDRIWPQGGQAQTWRRLLNETQMILHQHREYDPALPASLWFWGAGALPASPSPARVTRLEARSPLWRAAGAWGGLEIRPPQPDEAVMPGTLLEWPVDHADSADENLKSLVAWLTAAWRRLRLQPGFQGLELACEHRVWQFRTVDAWRIW